MKSLILALACLFFLAGPAVAQDCTLGVYANPEGTLIDFIPTPLELASFYVVMFTEDTAAAAAYSIDIPADIFVQARISGPSGDGLVIDEPTGTNVALTECVIGFGGTPVLIDEYQYVVLPGFCCAFITIGPNASQDPDLPQYITCNDLTRDCGIGPALYIGHVDPVNDRSFGAVKALFH